MIRVPIQVNDRTIYTVDIQRSVYGMGSDPTDPASLYDYRWRVHVGQPALEKQTLVEAGWVTHRYGDGAIVLVAKVMDMINEKMILDVLEKEKA